jgi:hypothetical protein
MGRSTFGVLYAGWVVTVIVGSVVQVYGFKQELSAYYVVFQLITGAVFAYILQDKGELAWIGDKVDKSLAAHRLKRSVDQPITDYVPKSSNGIVTRPASRLARVQHAGHNVASQVRTRIHNYNEAVRADKEAFSNRLTKAQGYFA